MTLKEKFDNVEIMFENQIGSLKYDELSEASNHCEKIADDFAIGFAQYLLEENLSKDLFIELLKIYKKKNL